MVTPADCVLDTNVFLDMYSNGDLLREYAKTGVTADSPEAIFRRARARESLLLCCYFNEAGAQTYSLRNEVLDQLEKLAPPKEDSVETYHTTQMIHFVTEFVFSNWKPMVINPKDGSEPKGNAADAALVAFAKEESLPLVTNEGFTKDGYGEGDIGRRAQAAGVTWYPPRKFYDRNIIEADQIGAFFERFRASGPEYLRTAPRGALDALLWMSGYFRHVLLGDAVGRDTPVRVTV